MTEDTRERFETWAKGPKLSLKRDGRFESAVYCEYLTHLAWQAWQAALSSAGTSGTPHTGPKHVDGAGSEWCMACGAPDRAEELARKIVELVNDENGTEWDERFDDRITTAVASLLRDEMWRE